MRNANIITLYKTKGDKGDCNNHRGISSEYYWESVRPNYAEESSSSTEFGRPCPTRQPVRFSIKVLYSRYDIFPRSTTRKCREQHLPLHIGFVDLTKAFDKVIRSGLCLVLKRIGCPPTLHQLIVSFHEDMKATVQYDGSISGSFDIRS